MNDDWLWPPTKPLAAWLPKPPSADLYEYIEQLADVGVFVYHSDHLNDADLYAFLTSEETLALQMSDPEISGGGLDLDVLGRYGPEERALHATYYGDDAHEKLPFDRDRHLPKDYVWLPDGM